MKQITRKMCMSVKGITIDNCVKCNKKSEYRLTFITYLIVIGSVYVCSKCYRKFINNEVQI